MRRKRYGDEENVEERVLKAKSGMGMLIFSILLILLCAAGHSRRSENSSGWLGDCAGGNSCVDRIYFVGWAAYHSSQ